MECIVLAGGMGTRLRGTIGEFPKCMAPVNEKPFLHYIFEELEQQECTRVVLSLGYKHEVITEWLKTQNRPFEITYVIEEVPLGTGGGIQLALKAAKATDVAVLNGDTMFRVSLKGLLSFHRDNGAETTLALKPMQHFDRYGIVNIDDRGRVTSFEEKQPREDGLINGGVYVINRKKFLERHMPEKFSFEKDYMEQHFKEGSIYGYISENYFIDIGIPEDYYKAQEDFKQMF